MGKRLPDPLNEKEVKRLWSQIKRHSRNPERDRAIIASMLMAGLRLQETLDLRPRDIDFKEKRLRVRDKGKGGKHRVIPVRSDYLDVVNDWIYEGEIDEEGKLFDISKRRIQQIIPAMGRHAKINRQVHPHLLRHTYAVNLLKSGLDVRTLQKLLGHSSLNTTMVYLRLSVGDIEKALEDHPIPYSLE